MFDTQGSMIGSGALIAGLIYAGTSMYVTGPLVTQRLVEKSGWLARCERNIKQEIGTSQSMSPALPQIDCGAILRNLDPAMRRLIETFGGGVACQMADAKRRQQEALAEFKRQRLRNIASLAGSRCQCAVSTLTDTKRLSVGLYAGSARLIQPGIIRNLDGELTVALHGAYCAGITKVGSGS